MNMLKRISLFLVINLLIVLTISLVLGVLGISTGMGGQNLDLVSLAGFCLIWGFGAALISLAMSRVMAKWMMRVKVIDPLNPESLEERQLVSQVHRLAKQAGLTTMPQVGFYESDEINAFATGPTKNRALVAVSTGLLRKMNPAAVAGVLAHEVAHITNGDMVTMTLIQGLANAMVMFIARVGAWFASQWVEEDRRPAVRFGVTIAAELLLGVLGMIAVSYFSRIREYRADLGGAKLSGKTSMIAALRSLQQLEQQGPSETGPQVGGTSLATLKISGNTGKWLALFSTHPRLEERIQRLESLRDAHSEPPRTRRISSLVPTG